MLPAGSLYYTINIEQHHDPLANPVESLTDFSHQLAFCLVEREEICMTVSALSGISPDGDDGSVCTGSLRLKAVGIRDKLPSMRRCVKPCGRLLAGLLLKCGDKLAIGF